MQIVKLFYSGNPKTGTLTNSKDPDEMPHNAAYHQGLRCLSRKTRSSEKNTFFFVKSITRHP